MKHTKGKAKIVEDFGQTEDTPTCYIEINEKIYFQTIYDNDKANAEHFVNCWNSHDDLLAACKMGLKLAQILNHLDEYHIEQAIAKAGK